MQAEAGLSDLTEVLISGSACFIALSALILAIWEGHQQRRHNKLSVAPKLRIDCSVSRSSEFFGLVLSNCGFGPAIISRFEVAIDGAALAGARFSTLPSLLAIEDILTWAFPDDDDLVKPGEDIPLFGTYTKNADDSDCARMKAALKRIEIQVSYRSFYGEQHTVAVIGRELRSISDVPMLDKDTKANGSHNTVVRADG